MMKSSAISLLLASSAAAFAPPSSGRGVASNQGLFMKAASTPRTYENEIGAMDPTGYWDPLDLSSGVSQETFDKYREAEVKHGRVCMLAIIGYIVPEQFGTWPGEVAPGIPFSDVPNGIQALEVIPSLGWMQMFFLIGAVDYWGFLGPKYFPTGTLPGLSEEEMNFRKTSELAHGRTAMLGFLELLRHNCQDVANGVEDFSPFYFPTYKVAEAASSVDYTF